MFFGVCVFLWCVCVYIYIYSVKMTAFEEHSNFNCECSVGLLVISICITELVFSTVGHFFLMSYQVNFCCQ